MFEECFGDGPFIFRINETGTGPQLLIQLNADKLMQVCLERGWREYNPDGSDDSNWNLWWRTTGFPINHHKNIYSWQYLNHIPKGAIICRKDNLIRHLRCMKKVHGTIYDFTPNGFNLPLEYTKLAAECTNNNRSSSFLVAPSQPQDHPIWICKPVAQSQGRGIFLFKKLSELNYDTNTIVQRYIEKPLLIGGYKFDLRLYVCVPSYHPLVVYMYREGLARFGTDKFSLNDLRNPFRHLTNCSINKFGPGYTEMKDRIGAGCKWTLRQLRRYFRQAQICDWLIWQKIVSLVILTIISQLQQVPQSTNCYEFFGFDILIDNRLKPWLLEVNLSPALSNDCDADELVKKPMLHDMFDLLGLPLYNTGLSIFNIWLDDGEEKSSPSLNGTVKALTAASKWRKKYKRMSAPTQCKTTNRGQSAVSVRNYMTLPKVQVGTTLNIPKKWGNGRDWCKPKPREGGWVRLWPFDAIEDQKIEPNIKTMVNQVSKFNKTAKELAKKHLQASEGQLSEFLQNQANVSGDIWIPPL